MGRLLEKANLISIIITGSNGKTTTARMVAECLTLHGLHIVWNTSGANMLSGVVSAIIEKCDILERLRADAAVLEVDEANLGYIMRAIKPKIVLVTNCFRDQLDRYGEVHTTLGLIRMALEDLPAGSTLLLNADDPLVASLASVSRGNAMFYGIEDTESLCHTGTGGTGGDASAGCWMHDARSCPDCGASYKYHAVVYGHLGRYYRPVCGLSRPAPHFGAFNIAVRAKDGFTFTVAFKCDSRFGFVNASLALPGLYNVYNCLAAVACCLVLNIPKETIEKGIARTSSAFGRMERMRVGEYDILITLVKNPVGFSEVIKTISADGSDKTIVACLNDNFADGRDISWIWDVDMELLSKNLALIKSVIVSGTRAEDFAIRFKYAGVDSRSITVETDLWKALELGLKRVSPGETLHVLATYTAMLKVREHVRREAHGREFWRA